MNVIYGGDIRRDRVGQPLQPGEHVVDGRFTLWPGYAGQVPKVPVLVRVKQQRTRQRIDDLCGRRYVPGLLQPGVPGDADPG